MFTNAAFLELEPDMIIQLIPLGRPAHRTDIFHQIKTLLEKEFPEMLVDADRGMIAIYTRRVKMPLNILEASQWLDEAFARQMEPPKED